MQYSYIRYHIFLPTIHFLIEYYDIHTSYGKRGIVYKAPMQPFATFANMHSSALYTCVESPWSKSFPHHPIPSESTRKPKQIKEFVKPAILRVSIARLALLSCEASLCENILRKLLTSPSLASWEDATCSSHAALFFLFLSLKGLYSGVS